LNTSTFYGNLTTLFSHRSSLCLCCTWTWRCGNSQ